MRLSENFSMTRRFLMAATLRSATWSPNSEKKASPSIGPRSPTFKPSLVVCLPCSERGIAANSLMMKRVEQAQRARSADDHKHAWQNEQHHGNCQQDRHLVGSFFQSDQRIVAQLGGDDAQRLGQWCPVSQCLGQGCHDRMKTGDSDPRR